MPKIELAYSPRQEFVDFHQRNERNALMVCHRRMGKTVACIGDLVVRALHTTKKDARFGYVAPFRQQAKEIAWVYLKNMTEGIRSEKPRESELRVKLVNGSWITLYGADNPDALRGLYFDGLILDEFGDMKPSLMGEVILPCLADRLGFLVQIGTVKGRNQFYDYAQKAMAEDSHWFYKNRKASETGLIPQDELDRMLEIMGEAQYAQEMENDWDAALPGRYYTDMINMLQERGQLVDRTLHNPMEKVYVAADLGLRDSAAWWFWQPTEEGINVIDYYEASGVYLDHYIEMLHRKGYDYHQIWLPHDAKAKTLATRRSTIEQLHAPHTVRPDLYRESDRLPVKIVPKLSKQHGIDAVRLMLPTCTFDEPRCHDGLDALRSYRRKFNETTQAFADEPLHDWSSDGADAFRYLSLVAEKSVIMYSELKEQGRHTVGTEQNSGYCLNDLWEDRGRKWQHDILRVS